MGFDFSIAVTDLAELAKEYLDRSLCVDKHQGSISIWLGILWQTRKKIKKYS